MINQIQSVCNSSAKKNGELASDLKILSKLIGAFFGVIPTPKFS